MGLRRVWAFIHGPGRHRFCWYLVSGIDAVSAANSVPWFGMDFARYPDGMDFAVSCHIVELSITFFIPPTHTTLVVGLVGGRALR